MNNRPLYGFLLLLLAVLAGASLWLEYAVQTQRLGGRWFGVHSPDYIIRRFSVTRTNLLGQKQYTLWADYAEHFPGDDTTSLTLPRMEAQDVRQGTVTVRADQAFATAKAKQVNFIGHVVLVRDLHDGQGPITLTTDYLEAFPDQQLIRTTHPVVVVGQKLHMTAGGLEMDNRNRWVHLSRRVRAQYEIVH